MELKYEGLNKGRKPGNYKIVDLVRKYDESSHCNEDSSLAWVHKLLLSFKSIKH